jgi:hypothetical protein
MHFLHFGCNAAKSLRKGSASDLHFTCTLLHSDMYVECGEVSQDSCLGSLECRKCNWSDEIGRQAYLIGWSA